MTAGAQAEDRRDHLRCRQARRLPTPTLMTGTAAPPPAPPSLPTASSFEPPGAGGENQSPCGPIEAPEPRDDSPCRAQVRARRTSFNMPRGCRGGGLEAPVRRSARVVHEGREGKGNRDTHTGGAATPESADAQEQNDAVRRGRRDGLIDLFSFVQEPLPPASFPRRRREKRGGCRAGFAANEEAEGGCHRGRVSSRDREGPPRTRGRRGPETAPREKFAGRRSFPEEAVRVIERQQLSRGQATQAETRSRGRGPELPEESRLCRRAQGPRWSSTKTGHASRVEAMSVEEEGSPASRPLEYSISREHACLGHDEASFAGSMLGGRGGTGITRLNGMRIS